MEELKAGYPKIRAFGFARARLQGFLQEGGRDGQQSQVSAFAVDLSSHSMSSGRQELQSARRRAEVAETIAVRTARVRDVRGERQSQDRLLRKLRAG